MIQPFKHENFSSDAVTGFGNLSDPIGIEIKRALADFIDRQVTSGNWNNSLLVFQLRALGGANGLRDLKGTVHATNQGSTSTPGYGYIHNGTSSYIDTGFIPSTHGGSLYTQNDAGIGCVVMQNTTPTQTGYVFGAWDASARRTTLMQNGSASVDYRINGATSTVYNTDTRIYRGMYTLRRSSSSAVAIAINGNQLATAAQTSNALTNQPVYEGCLNTSGVAGNYLGVDVGAFFVFRQSTFNGVSFYRDLVVLLQRISSLYGNPYPTWLQVVPFINGQSNAAGFTTDNPSTSELQNALTDVYMYDGSWNILENGVNNAGDTGAAGDNFGMELTLGKTLRDYYSREVRMAKHARFGAPVHQAAGVADYNATNVDPADYYPGLLSYIDGCHTKMHLLDVMPVFVWIIIQGEAERSDIDFANAWVQNWLDVETKLGLSGCGFSFVIISKLSNGLTFDADPTVVTKLRTEAQAFGENDKFKRRFFYDMERLGSLDSGNYPHYHGAQYEQFGVDIGNIIIQRILV